MQIPESTRMTIQAVASTNSMWLRMPIVPAAVKAAKVRECPTSLKIRGAQMQPTKKPKKCAEPRSPISERVNSSWMPEMASRGASPPDPSCSSRTDRSRAANEISMRIVVTFRAP